MQKLKVSLGDRSYPIYIGEGTLQNRELLLKYTTSQQILLVSNSTVAPLYVEQIRQNFSDSQCEIFILPDGERYKSLQHMERIITQLLELRFDRNCCLVALGGGVVGDITGFAAACYQRGVRFIQIPTTLLAQVDSSVGGKTAVNHRLGKNMIGAYYQPSAVLIDTCVLDSVPDREFRAGLAEIIKYGLIRDPDFFEWLETNMPQLQGKEPAALMYAIERSCMNKAEIVSQDERESGLRAVLNLGHTFGHAIETALNYQDWRHGEAVGCGLLMAARFSYLLGDLDEEAVERVRRLLEHTGLPVMLPNGVTTRQLIEIMSVDKKTRNKKKFLVLLKAIGKCVVTADYNQKYLIQMIEEFIP